MRDSLFVGVGWTDLAITLNRIAVGAFFSWPVITSCSAQSANRTVVDELKALGVPAVGFNQWWVPLVEFTAGLKLRVDPLGGFPCTTRSPQCLLQAGCDRREFPVRPDLLLHDGGERALRG
jgi:hypothetical protein